MAALIKEPIRIRQRRIDNGNISLFLDTYYKGMRKYEFLRLYLVPEKNKADREKNKETLRFAEAIKAKRLVELRNGEYGFKNNDGESTPFFAYLDAFRIKNYSDKKRESVRLTWEGATRHLRNYAQKENITFREITPEWCRGFYEYLNNAVALSTEKKQRKYAKPLSDGTKNIYFSTLKSCLNNAVRDGYISRNPAEGVRNFTKEESARMYLTIEELKRLINTPCIETGLRNAFLFSCITGLRRSDVVGLKWRDVTKQGGYTRIIFRQKKTKGQEYLDITPQAADLMGERKGGDDNVFPDMHSHSYGNRILQQWVKDAGIDKKITFHCGRHTFAVMMIDLGTDLFTVSKLLGHTDVKTTQIYAKVLDKNKQVAVSNIPRLI